jgi:cytochrome oxidase Cu insertion factor (SCO1/SenC/PrrC family)
MPLRTRSFGVGQRLFKNFIGIKLTLGGTKIKRVYILLMIFGILAILSPKVFLNAAEDPLSDAGIRKIKVRIDAPEFAIEDLNGKKVALKDFRGKVVMVNFWTTW